MSCERDVSLLYPSGIPSTGTSPVAALFAYLSATSLPLAPLCAGTHRMMVTSLSLARMLEQNSMAATAKRWPGPRASSLTRLMAEVEPTPCTGGRSPVAGQGCGGAGRRRRSLRQKTPCWCQGSSGVRSTPPPLASSRHKPLLPLRCPVGSRRSTLRLYGSTRRRPGGPLPSPQR